MTKKIHNQKSYIPLHYNDRSDEMRGIERKNGTTVEFKNLKTAETYCKKHKVPFIAERIFTVHRVTLKNE